MRSGYSHALTSMVAAHAMKYCSNMPELHQAPSHGCAEKLFFGIGYENMFSVVYKSIIRGSGKGLRVKVRLLPVLFEPEREDIAPIPVFVGLPAGHLLYQVNPQAPYLAAGDVRRQVRGGLVQGVEWDSPIPYRHAKPSWALGEAFDLDFPFSLRIGIIDHIDQDLLHYEVNLGKQFLKTVPAFQFLENEGPKGLERFHARWQAQYRHFYLRSSRELFRVNHTPGTWNQSWKLKTHERHSA